MYHTYLDGRLCTQQRGSVPVLDRGFGSVGAASASAVSMNIINQKFTELLQSEVVCFHSWLLLADIAGITTLCTVQATGQPAGRSQYTRGDFIYTQVKLTITFVVCFRNLD